MDYATPPPPELPDREWTVRSWRAFAATVYPCLAIAVAVPFVASKLGDIFEKLRSEPTTSAAILMSVPMKGYIVIAAAIVAASLIVQLTVRDKRRAYWTHRGVWLMCTLFIGAAILVLALPLMDLYQYVGR